MELRLSGFGALLGRAQASGRRRVALVAAEDAAALAAVAAADELGFLEPVLIGAEERVRGLLSEHGLVALARNAEFVHEATPEGAAQRAVALARDGWVEVILKGQLRTEQLLRAVLAPEGLRTGRLLSDVLLYEDRLGRESRLVAVTDGGINVAPDLEAHAGIVANAVGLMRSLGWASPRVALLSATEAVSESVPSTVRARELTERAEAGEFGECEVFGPLALDNALLESAARAKGIASAVAGRADVMVVPNIEAGNILGKAVKYLGGSACGHVVVGAAVPVLIPSRVESREDKLNSLALGVLVYGG